MTSGVSEVVGLLAVAIGAVANGSFSVPLKLCRRRFPDLPDPVFQAYWSLSVAAVSLLTIPVQCTAFDEPCFEWKTLGLAGALACALATVCVFIGVRHLGVGLPPSIYAASFIAAGAIEDLFFLGKEIEGVGLFVLSISLIFVAVVGVAVSKILSTSITTGTSFVGSITAGSSFCTHELPLFKDGADTMRNREETEQKHQNWALGMVASLAVGVFGSFTPFSSIKAGGSPFGFVASFGIGMPVVHLVVCPLVLLAGVWNGTIKREGEHSIWHARAAVPFALLSGALWGLGNAGLNYALTVGVDFSVAVSIYQCGLLVSGLWGIFFFQEIRNRVPIFVFFLCGCLLICGVAIESRVVV